MHTYSTAIHFNYDRDIYDSELHSLYGGLQKAQQDLV